MSKSQFKTLTLPKKNSKTTCLSPLSPSHSSGVVFQNVTFAHKNGEEVLRSIQLDIQKGSLCFLTGASGVGKSSLLQLIYRAFPTFLGSISVNGKEVKSLSENELSKYRQNIGIVFQEFALLDHLTTIDNVALPLILRGEPLDSARDQAAELLSWLGLGSCLQKNPEFLSGGQRQRIAIARAVITNPDFILADEPTGHVDDENAEKVMSLFEHLHKEGKTILISTHNAGLLKKYKGNTQKIFHLHLVDGYLHDITIESIHAKEANSNEAPEQNSNPKDQGEEKPGGTEKTREEKPITNHVKQKKIKKHIKTPPINSVKKVSKGA